MMPSLLGSCGLDGAMIVVRFGKHWLSGIDIYVLLRLKFMDESRFKQ